MRRVRKIVTYACTTCFKLFSSAKDAKTHAATHPAPTPRRAPGAGRRRGPTQTGKILDAVRAGAKTAEAVAKKAKIPLERVHSLLSYHRRMGNIKGFTGDLKVNNE